MRSDEHISQLNNDHIDGPDQAWSSKGGLVCCDLAIAPLPHFWPARRMSSEENICWTPAFIIELENDTLFIPS